MLSIKSLQVTTYDADKLTVSWEFNTTSESFSDYTIDVYRSEAPGQLGVDQYYHVASGISATTDSYDDTTVSGLFHPNRTWFYKLKLTQTSSGKTAILFDTTPAYIKSHSVDKYTLEIIRRKKQIQDNFSGRPIYIMRRRTYGTRCPVCWDETLFRRKIDDDTTCYGTGVVGGYFTPVAAKAVMNSAPKYNQITMFGEWYPSNILLNITGVPPLKTADVIIDDAAKRWMVKSVNTIEKGGVIVEQACQLSLIDGSDVLYKIAVPT
tara:strand:+ start:503 stop:1297 length:795 start_codon:yes stop_codon:yes gene_type:complete